MLARTFVTMSTGTNLEIERAIDLVFFRTVDARQMLSTTTITSATATVSIRHEQIEEKSKHKPDGCVLVAQFGFFLFGQESRYSGNLSFERWQSTDVEFWCFKLVLAVACGFLLSSFSSFARLVLVHHRTSPPFHHRREINITMFQFIVLLSFIAAAFATYGLDISQATSKSSFECLKSNGYNFAIVRVYQSNGKCDVNGPTSINNAWNGGMSHVDGYIFPCYSCGNPAKQIDDTINYLSSHAVTVMKEGELAESYNSTSVGAKVGMLWLDIEGTQYWSGSTTNNVNFLSSMVSEGKARGVSLGIYSSASQWNPIMGGSTKFSSLPLWYAHYDGNPSFSDFSAFGGWSKPAIKQYKGTTSICSTSIDKNYY